MKGLVEWLRAQIAEDRQVAAKATAGPWRAVHQEWPEIPGGTWLVDAVSDGGPVVEAGQEWTPGGCFQQDAEHIARWDPDRVLGLCDAMDQVIQAVERFQSGHPGPCDNEHSPYDADCELHGEWMKTALKPYALQLLAVPYADRPGYLEEWKPE